MKTILLSTVTILILGVSSIYSQGFWEPQTNITGYIATEFNYFDELQDYRTNYGSAVSEAGILITYQPTERFTMKSVFVYRPDFTFDQMLNEAFGQYSLSQKVNIKVGRFLLPVSPMNTYYYAPVNTSATLPVLITNNEFFPLNIDGVSVNGSIGNEFRVSYDLFGGGYRNTTWLKTGAVGFFGDESAYFKKQIGSEFTVDQSYQNTYNVAFGGSVAFSYNNFVTLGFSAFKPIDETVPLGVNLPENALFPGSPATYIIQEFTFEKIAYGVNLRLQHENTRFVAELWDSNLKADGGDVDLNGAFAELSHTINRFTPYVRYEQQQTDDVEFRRYTAGINYKPTFERALKLEYLFYDHEVKNINGVVATFIYSF
ncbi:MAG: hypothetical protein JJU41_07795 [Bacteroidetes bacterium]|nr:hypothetical protein [Bacteroidota bacterium]MCH8524236.1 hypothetical protein [Balneolales bacterium]